jgi:tRNA dimethylallyltransferase
VEEQALPGLVVAVVGPTGVGKTAIGEELASRSGGEIISADSMQVYRGMDVGTAKPPAAERRVPYHCIDLVEPGEPYSAALYQRDARAAIHDVLARGGLPVVVGGTGLYVRAALDEMSFPKGEAVSPARDRLEALAGELGPQGLHARLAELDPDAAALIHPNNTRRVIRALEMFGESGISYASQAATFAKRRSAYRTAYVGLTMERFALYERIDRRVDAMIAGGLEEEVRGLLAAGYREALTAAQAIGYKELVPVLESGAPLYEAIAAIKQASRRYAKRQLTWFRADPRVIWLDVTELSPAEAADAAERLVESVTHPVPPHGSAPSA